MTSDGPGGVGRRLGRYHLGDTLGGGPTGVVYRAKVFGVAGFERQFAIKRFHDELVGSPSMAAKVAGAARSYGSLEHPNIARLHEFGVAGGDTFTATELVEGIDLRQLAASLRGGVKPGAAAAALSQAARAVGFSHGKGHSHLGICPTNVLFTPSGAVKVSDFGLLPPRLPKRPAHDPTLDARIPFLAPEQLAGEPTSAATDVFQLGVMGYILFVGEPPFAGPSAFEVAQMILSAQAPEPVLPRPVSRVLRRCLARSPFERYPDGSALADAIEEAAHEAALPGTSGDIGVLVRAELERGPRPQPAPAPPEGRIGAPRGETAPRRVVRGPGKLSSTALKKTMTGVAPGAAGRGGSGTSKTPPASAPRPAARADSVSEDAETAVKPVPFRSLKDHDSLALGPAGASVDDAAAIAAPSGGSGLSSIPEPVELGKSGRRGSTMDVTLRQPVEGGLGAGPGPRPDTDDDADTELHEEAATRLMLRKAGPSPQGPAASAPPAARAPDTEPRGIQPAPDTERRASGSPPANPSATDPVQPPERVQPPGGPIPPVPAPQPGSMQPEGGPGLAGPPPPGAGVAPGPFPPPGAPEPGATRGKRSGKRLVIIALVAAVLGGGGFAAYTLYIEPELRAEHDANRGDGETATGTGDTPSAAAVSPADAGAPDAAPPDAAPATLTIESVPEGARIFLDGTELGTTPHTMDGTDDKHRLALILPGHDLHLAEIDGRGTVKVELETVTPTEGRGGIKVRCRTENRYYVFVDGEPTGQLCPTKRLHVPYGDHTVEIYDPVTETRNTFGAFVKKVNWSRRVYVD